ncbi:hypothetical protein OV090_19575 [Nannocystis sp. RBIL2]|uniref:hypothetical protein n=1 Tax=Nannocystis sp. RBIL2 TaxID=2996788 RepID=UPI00226FF33F|nr:hypothetical protein [Nannocystis sp. RBIL2]MCY1066981.1 hypothetical protein [Nannocystis sp. RBIL2]
MDDKLAEWDLVIEETATFLQTSPPTGRIQYVWVALPVYQVESATDVDWSEWGCRKDLRGCYHYQNDDGRGVVHTKTLEHLHELVHAVDIPALGYGHRVLEEGLATYLGSWYSSEGILDGFPASLKDMITAEQFPDDYLPAMHFVGSILERDGVSKFKELRTRVSRRASLEEFAEAYKVVYGEDFEAALVKMSSTPVQGRIPLLSGCKEGPEVVPWASPGLVDTMLYGECGDGGFFGGGFVGDWPGFMKDFAVEVGESGYYEMTVTGPGAESSQLHASIDGCFDGSSTISSSDGQTGFGFLTSGRHAMRVFFPQSSAPRGELHLRLQWVAPPKP